MLRVIAMAALVSIATAWRTGLPHGARRGTGLPHGARHARGSRSVHMVTSWYDSGMRLRSEETAGQIAAPVDDIVSLERAKVRSIINDNFAERATWSSIAQHGHEASLSLAFGAVPIVAEPGTGARGRTNNAVKLTERDPWSLEAQSGLRVEVETPARKTVAAISAQADATPMKEPTAGEDPISQERAKVSAIVQSMRMQRATWSSIAQYGHEASLSPASGAVPIAAEPATDARERTNNVAKLTDRDTWSLEAQSGLRVATSGRKTVAAISAQTDVTPMKKPTAGEDPISQERAKASAIVQSRRTEHDDWSSRVRSGLSLGGD